MDNMLKELQDRIGYHFQDDKLLKKAMVHSSYANEKHLPKYECNERLEFLGDAVLELISSEFLFSAAQDDAGRAAYKDARKYGVRTCACFLCKRY